MTPRSGKCGRRVGQRRRRRPRRHPDEPGRTQRGNAGGETSRAARLDDYVGVSGAAADVAREFGVRTAVRRADQRRGPAVGRDHSSGPPASSRCPRIPRPGWPGSPSWPRPRSRTPRRAWSCAVSPRSRPRCGGWRPLVARAAPPEEVFAAVAAEAGRLLAVDVTRHQPVRPGRHGGRRRRVGLAAVAPCPSRSAQGCASAGGTC